MNKVKTVVVAATITCSGAAGVIGYFEGKSNAPYYDPLHIKSVCYGETHVTMRVYTDLECKEMLDARTQVFWDGISKIVRPRMTTYQHAAFTINAYNIGLLGFQRSSMARLANRGDFIGACKALLLYVYGTDSRSGQRIGPMAGLVKRRTAEYTLCMGTDLELQ